jgi:hypothetical protein
MIVFFVFFVYKTARNQVNAASNVRSHKVIAQPGILDTSVLGIDLWHDYGSYGLYKVSDDALMGLSQGARERLQVVDEMDVIHLDAYPFNTQLEIPDLPDQLAAGNGGGQGLYLVQFVGPIKAAWLLAVKNSGAELVHYIAQNGYLVWADEGNMDAIRSLVREGNFLQYAGVYQPYFKVGRSISDRVITMNDPEEVIHLTVQMYSHPGKAATEERIKALSLEQITRWHPILAYQNAEFTLRVGDIPTIVNFPDVFWVGERLERELMDEVQGQILANNLEPGLVGPSGPGYLAWLEGYGFSQEPGDYPIVDISDDGVGNGTVNSGDYTLHEMGNLENPSRLAYIQNCTSALTGEGVGGHGHINTSIAGGYDVSTGSPYQDVDGFNLGLGINPYGRFAGTRIFSAGFDVTKCGGTDTGLIKSIQDNGAQISSHSWGCGLCAGSYDESSQAFDVGTRDADMSESGNQEMIFVFAAGNDGPSFGTIGTPGNGKNVITVGASENDRPTWTDGCGVGPTGANNAMDVISFSSRGPAPGGRVKPEVIAPGTHIQGTASTSSSYSGSSVCDNYWPPGQTIFAASSGTSHSTPAVSGVASLYYYWLENEYGISPSPAFMKAYLIAHPTYLTGVSADDTLPSDNQGYGMPNMELALDDTSRYMVDQIGVLDNSGETWQFSGSVADPAKPIRIVMAYTDKAGAVGTSPQVNDLNLNVEVGGNTYLGNHFSGGWSIPNGSPDSANNYEAVFLELGMTGPITITVTGFNIADDGVPNFGDSTDQDFALVCYNCAEHPDFTLQVTPQTRAICVPEDGQYDVSVGQVVGYNYPVTLSAAGIPAGTTASFITNPVIPPTVSVLTIGNTGGLSFGSYSLDVIGLAPTSTHTVTVGLEVYTDSPGVVTLQLPGIDATDQLLTPTFEWTEAVQASTYTLEVGLDLDFGALVYTATVAGTRHTAEIVLDAETWYHWRVRADNSCGSGSPSGVYAFRTMDVAPVLVVDDDDNDPDVRSFYTETLDTLGVLYDIWDTGNSDNEPTDLELNPYDVVIWFSGSEYWGYAGPGSDGEEALGSWLDHGKCLFISSQDYYFDHGLTSFMQTYLGVAVVDGDVGSYSNILGSGSGFGGIGPYGLSYPFIAFPDVLNPDETAETSFIGTNGQDAGVSKSNGVYKTAFLGFPFEGLASFGDRQEILGRFLNWCSSDNVFMPLVIR